MKLSKIIIKNFKILLRSKSSALIMIFGPLVLISLVGLAFNNTSGFSINIGYQTESNNDLVQSYMSEIDTTTYTITAYENIDECINNIKLSSIHACIDFPADFEIRNDKTNEIIFYVDKSKVNLVYSVIDTISKSFSRASSNLSVELTNDILSVVNQNKQGLIDANKDIDEIIELNEEVKEKSDKLQRELNTIVINTKEASSSTGNLDDISEDLEDDIKDQQNLAKEIHTHFSELSTATADCEGETSEGCNRTIWSKKEVLIEDEIYSHVVEGEIFKEWNETNTQRIALTNIVNSLTSSVTDMIDDIDTAKKTQSDVSKDLKEDINPKIDENIELANSIKTNLNSLIFLIDNIEVSDAENIANPITTKVETIAPENSHLGSLFPSLIILLIMFISILVAANLILMEKNSKAYFRNYTTPTNDSLFILSTYITAILMVAFQILIILGIAAFVFKAPLIDNIGLISFLIFISSTLFVFIGMAIGYLFNTEETAMMGAISISSLFLLLSDLILPLESMPKYLIEIARYNPFVLGSDTLRQVMLFNVNFDNISGDIGLMFGFSMIILILMIVIQQVMKLVYLSSFSRKRVKINKKTNVKDYFKINNNPVTDLEGLIKVIRHMSDKDFKKHISKRNNIVVKWLIEVMKNVDLAEKIKEKKKKEDIIFILKRAISTDIEQIRTQTTKNIKIK